MNTQKQIGLMVSLLFLLFAGCAAYTVVDLPIRAVDQTTWHEEESIERGALLYANNCRTCHGIKGEGSVGPQLNKPDFQDQDPLVLRNNRNLLLRTLSCGRAGTLMPAWLDTNGGALNERQVEHIVNFLTAPATEPDPDDPEVLTSKGWIEAVEFGHNLNKEQVLIVGGDTLGILASNHELGLKELRELNGGIDPDQAIKKGTKVKLPPAKGRPGDYKVRKDNETLRKIEQTMHIGATVLAELNGIGYRLKEKGTQFELLASEKSATVGLLPGKTLKFPADSTYIVRSGDTLATVAAAHGVSESDLARLNSALEKDDKGVLAHEAKLTLADTKVIVQPGDTVNTIAKAHGITDEAFAKASNLDPKGVLQPGTTLALPANTRYIIQAGDTLARVAAAHGLAEADLARLNNTQPGAILRNFVTAKLPAVDSYPIKSQSLEQIAATLAGVTAAQLGAAQTPAAPETSLYAVGTQLKMPENAYGSAPPDAKNDGTACVQHAVPPTVFDEILGGGPAAQAPANTSTNVKIEANANDWTVTADGTKQDPNKGAVKVAKGTNVLFTSLAGLHNIFLNGAKQGADLKQGDQRNIVFADAGTFKVTCSYHPSMLATVFVE